MAPVLYFLINQYKEWLNICVKRFNEKSKESTVNSKEIEVISINEKEIRIKLHTEIFIGKVPGRALTMLSRYLIDDKEPGYDKYFFDQLFHKNFLLSKL